MPIAAAISGADYGDCFLRLSPQVAQQVSLGGLDPLACAYRLGPPRSPRYLTAHPRVDAGINGVAVDTHMLPQLGLPGGAPLALEAVPLAGMQPARRVVVTPLGWADQLLAEEHAEQLSSSAILEQVRLVCRRQVLPIHVGGHVLRLQVKGCSPDTAQALQLAVDTELEIELPHRRPAAAPPAERILSLVADAHVEPGTARFNLADFMDFGWQPLDDAVYLVIEAFGGASVAAAASSGQSKRVRPGTLHVSPQAMAALRVPSTAYAMVTSTAEVEAVGGLAVQKHALTDTRSLLKPFINRQRYIVPAQLLAGSFTLAVPSPRPFVSLALDAPLEETYDLRPAPRPAPPPFDFAPYDAQLEAAPPGVCLVSGAPGSGKSTWIRHLAATQRCILYDFEEHTSTAAVEALFGRIREHDLLMPASTAVALDHVDWFLHEDAGAEALHADDRWAMAALRSGLAAIVGGLERPVLLVSSGAPQHVPRLQARITSTVRVAREAPAQGEPYRGPAWADLHGLDGPKQALLESVVWPIRHAALFEANSLARSGGVLLHGPTGCGKTALMGALASLEGVRLLHVRGPELLSKYVGASEAAVRSVFAAARLARPCVVAFDEIDALAPRRGQDNTGVTDRVVNQLLTEIDGTGEREGIFVVATSSRRDLIDPALLRSGRIERHVEIALPGAEERRLILQAMLPGLEAGALATATAGFTPADLRALLHDAHLRGGDLLGEALRLAPAFQAPPGPARGARRARATFA